MLVLWLYKKYFHKSLISQHSNNYFEDFLPVQFYLVIIEIYNFFNYINYTRLHHRETVLYISFYLKL